MERNKVKRQLSQQSTCYVWSNEMDGMVNKTAFASLHNRGFTNSGVVSTNACKLSAQIAITFNQRPCNVTGGYRRMTIANLYRSSIFLTLSENSNAVKGF